MATLTKALNPVFRVGNKGVKGWNFGMKGSSMRAGTLSEVADKAKKVKQIINGKTYLKGPDGKWYLQS